MTFEHRFTSSDGEREALEFLGRARKLRGLSPMQFQRIEYRLAHKNRPNIKRIWIPALAVFCLVLIAGTAVARVVDLSRLPLIGPLFPARSSSPTPETLHPRTSRGPSVVVPPAVPPAGVGVPATPPAAIAAPSSVETSRNAVPSSGSVPADATPVVKSGSARNLSFAAPRGPARYTEPGDRGVVHEDITESKTPVVEEVRSGRNIEPEPVRVPIIDTRPRLAGGMASTNPVEEQIDPIMAESRSFSAAVAKWHRDHNADATLAALVAHERRFPGGQMQLETRLLRAEILLQQGHEREGLALLDSLSLLGLPRGRELQTVRGELRIKYGRCLDGRQDLDYILAKDRTDALARRAARAISLCP
jgi:hypothetical protein